MSRDNSMSRDNLKEATEDFAKIRERKQSIKISSIPGPSSTPSNAGRARQGSTFLNVLRRASKLDVPTTQPQEKKPPPKKTPGPNAVLAQKKQVKLAVGKYVRRQTK